MRSLLTFLLGCLALPAFAVTPISGGIYSNTTLTLANSPYQVTDDLVVFPDVLLSIEPGVEILVDAGKKIEVRGRVSAIGTAAQPVYIHGATPDRAMNFWEGFVFIGTTEPLGSGGQADFNYCNVSDARYAFNMDLAYHGPYRFRNGTFSYNAKVNHDGGMGGVLFDSCTFSNNAIGISWFQFGGTVSNSLFDGNVDGAIGTDRLINCRFINHKDVAMSPYGYTSGCEVYNNSVGVECYFNSTNKTFINNKIKHNYVGVRMQSYFNGSINFTGNEICDNTMNNVELHTKNNADLSGNCWCDTDSASIRQKILDGYKDVSKGLISFMPFSKDCSGNGPATTPELQSEVPALTVSPNPVSVRSGIRVAWQGIADGEVRLQLRSITGRDVSYEREASGPGYAVLRSDAAAGIYYILLTNALTGATVTQKIVIQQ